MDVKDQAETLREMVKERNEKRHEELKENRVNRQRIIAVASGKGRCGENQFLCESLYRYAAKRSTCVIDGC